MYIVNKKGGGGKVKMVPGYLFIEGHECGQCRFCTSGFVWLKGFETNVAYVQNKVTAAWDAFLFIYYLFFNFPK